MTPFLLPRPSILQPIPRPEHPENHAHAQRQEEGDRAHTDFDTHVALAEEGPAEPADQIDDGIEQRHRAPCRRQHVERIEGAAEEGQRIDDEQRDDLQLLEALRPYSDDETEQAKDRTSVVKEKEFQYV